MNNDLDVWNDGGEVAPYQPYQPLPPALAPDYEQLIDNRDYDAGGTPTLFGHSLPPGVNEHAVEAHLAQIAAIYTTDAAKLGISPTFVKQAIRWFKHAATHPPGRQSIQHSFNLSNLTIPAEDRQYILAFCNWAAQIGASEEDTRRSLYWYSVLIDTLSQQQPPQQKLPDRTLQQIEARNDNYRQAGLNELQSRWGRDFPTKSRVVFKYFNSLSQPEKDHLENAVIGDRLALNDPDVIERLYREAVAHVQPQIDVIEKMMRENRHAYMRDGEVQRKYRELLTLRDGN